MSPDNKHFLSAGWVWGSFDAYNTYNVENFIQSNRIEDINIGGWEHESRANCWLDNETIAISYSPSIEQSDATADAENEIHLYKISNSEAILASKIKVGNIQIVNTEMHYSKQLNAFFVFSRSIGIVVLSLNGELLYENKKIEIDSYYPDENLFITIKNASIVVNRLTN